MNHDIFILLGDAAYALIVLAAALAMVACALFTLMYWIDYWKYKARKEREAGQNAENDA